MAGPGDSGFLTGSTGCLIGRMLILSGAVRVGVDGPEVAASE